MKLIKSKKQKQNNLMAVNRDLERLFINNPIDAPSAGLNVEEYIILLKAAEIMSNYHDIPISKEGREWSYFAAKWNSLHNFRVEEQLNNFNTYHDIISIIIAEWNNIQQSPYTYRCIASLIRMLGEEQG